MHGAKVTNAPRSRYARMSWGAKCVSISWTVWEWITCVTDGRALQTDGQNR